MNPHTSQALEFDRLISALVALAQTDEAREQLALLTPQTDLSDVKNEIARVEETRRLIQRSGSFPGGGVADIRQSLKRAAVAGSVLEEPQLLSVLHHLRIHSTTRKLIQREAPRMPLTSKLAAPLEPLPDLEAQLERAITPEATVRDSASPELSRLRRAVSDQMERLRAKLAALMPKLARLGVLREDSFSIREGRYVLPVRSDSMGLVKGIVHDRSATGDTLFVEPAALIDLGNELRTLELAERDEVRRILRELTTQVRTHIAQIEANQRVMTALDILWAKALLAEKLDANPPVVSLDRPLRIYGGRHPLLTLAGDREVVPLTLELGGDYGVLVISGPNAGGKSVALKCVGLTALMAACGLHIPALPGTEVPLYSAVEADIGDQQSIADDLSTFTAHALRLREILANAGPRTLILIDEIGAGTDPQEGASLSIAALEKLIERRAPTVVTTHNGALKAFAHTAEWCANGSMEFDLATFRPTYRFRPHLPGSSYALDIARRVGLPDDVIARARKLVGSERSQLEELIASLSEKLSRYDALVADQQQQTGLVAAQAEDYRQKMERLRDRERRLKQQTMQEVEEVLKGARKTVEAVVRDLREKSASADAIKTAHQTLGSLKKAVSERLDVPTIEVPQPPTRDLPPEPASAREAKVGDWVSVDGGGIPGQVTTISARGDRICVAVGSVQLWVARARAAVVQPPQEAAPAARSFVRRPEVPFELDVRGLDAPEALLRVDRYLDDGAATGRAKLGIIHGKGAGILSRHIRAHLKKHPLVESFRFGEYGEGDYGVTVVELKA